MLATKFALPMGPDANRAAAHSSGSSAAVEDSLRRFATDHIDPYQMHRRTWALISANR
jgi:aryl-alcohol dehydrogenase-like predicted oxidoreductase